MHTHAEIVLPPTRDVEAAVAEILAPWDENREEESRHAFWDWYRIGGRWTGEKIRARFDPDRLAAFYEELHARHVTVHGVQFGKPELSPPDQAAMIDALWREWFPEGGERCLLFKGEAQTMAADVCPVAEIPELLTCERLLIAGHRGSRLSTRRMLVREIWNGVEWQKTVFDGRVRPAVLEDMARTDQGPKADWLAVTIDYHS